MNKSDLVLHLHIFIPMYCFFYYNHGDGSLKRFWQIRETFHMVLDRAIFLPYTCLALLESFSISVHVFAS